MVPGRRLRRRAEDARPGAEQPLRDRRRRHSRLLDDLDAGDLGRSLDEGRATLRSRNLGPCETSEAAFVKAVRQKLLEGSN